MQVALLVLYFFIFWHKFIINPYKLCTSEIASTYFPHWRWMGMELRRGVFPASDNIYYKLPGSIPFLSTFYPPSLVLSYIGSFLSLDRAFRLYVYMIIGHYLLASLFAYWLFGNLFAAITLAYAGYVIKPNTPCFAFSVTWVPLALKGGVIGAVAWAMALFGGYYPVLVYVVPVIAFLQPLSCIAGCLMAVPQLIPFLGYFKRSVRMNQKPERNFGKLPPLMLTKLVDPSRFIGTVNGVHYPEVMMYMGIAVLFIFHASWWWVPLSIGICVAVGLLPSLQRVPARTFYLVSLCLTMLACQSEFCKAWWLILFQAWLLYQNSSIYPSFPFNQWWDRPSKLYHKKPKLFNWPYITGYLENRRTSTYEGAFRLVI